MNIDPAELTIYIAAFLIGGVVASLGILEYNNALDMTLYEKIVILLGITYILLFMISMGRTPVITTTLTTNFPLDKISEHKKGN